MRINVFTVLLIMPVAMTHHHHHPAYCVMCPLLKCWGWRVVSRGDGVGVKWGGLPGHVPMLSPPGRRTGLMSRGQGQLVRSGEGVGEAVSDWRRENVPPPAQC